MPLCPVVRRVLVPSSLSVFSLVTPQDAVLAAPPIFIGFLNKNVDGARRFGTRISKGDFGTFICILVRGERHNSYKIIRKRNYFSLITKFPAKNGELTPLKDCASALGTATHQEKREFLPTTSYRIKGESVEGTNLHMLLDLQVNKRIKNSKILPMFG